jgi:hypothetical protein
MGVGSDPYDTPGMFTPRHLRERRWAHHPATPAASAGLLQKGLRYQRPTRAIVARLRATTPLIVPSDLPLRNPEDRDLLLSGLRLAAGEARDPVATSTP